MRCPGSARLLVSGSKSVMPLEIAAMVAKTAIGALAFIDFCNEMRVGERESVGSPSEREQAQKCQPIGRWLRMRLCSPI